MSCAKEIEFILEAAKRMGSAANLLLVNAENVIGHLSKFSLLSSARSDEQTLDARPSITNNMQ